MSSTWERAQYNARQIRRLPKRGIAGGVLAGVADYFDWNTRLLRCIAVCLFLFVMGPFALVLYAIAWYVMDAAEPGASRAHNKGGQASPPAPESNLSRRFGSIDNRLRRLEACVTTNEYHLNREFEKLERGH